MTLSTTLVIQLFCKTPFCHPQDIDGICSNLAVVSPFLFYYYNFSSNLSECRPRAKLFDSGSFFQPCAFQSFRAIHVIYEYFSRDISILCWESCVQFLFCKLWS